jgi:membrane-associated protein
MRFSLYALYSVIGGVIWSDGILLLGRELGKIDWVRAHKGWLDYIVVGVVVVGLAPAALHYWQGRTRRT